MTKALLSCIILILLFSSCQQSNNKFERILPSPDSKKHLYFNVNSGEPYYLLYYEKNIIIDWSLLGFIIDDTIKFSEGLLLESIETRTSSHRVEDNFPDIPVNLDVYNEMTISLGKKDCADVHLSIVFRIYDNALAFKYVFNHLGVETNLIEITELDLYNNFFQKVALGDPKHGKMKMLEFPLEEIDTLLLPATFISNENYTVVYVESISQGYPSMKLVRRTPDKAEYQMKYVDNSMKEISINNGFETPWRIILISDNLK